MTISSSRNKKKRKEKKRKEKKRKEKKRKEKKRKEKKRKEKKRKTIYFILLSTAACRIVKWNFTQTHVCTLIV